jgi:hypothetical protein
LVLSTGPTDYHIIPVSKVVSCDVLSPAEASSKRQDDGAAEKEKEKEKERQAKLREEKLAKPPGVSNSGHRLFLALNKTYACLHPILPHLHLFSDGN